MITEKEKHYKKIQFYANEWEKFEKKAAEIKIKIIGLETDYKDYIKKANEYAKKTKGAILLEVF